MPKGCIRTSDDRQERLFAFIESRGGAPFTTRDAINATGLSSAYVNQALINRLNQRHLARELVDHIFQYRLTRDVLPVRARTAEVCDLVWQTLRATHQPMSSSAIRRQVEALSGNTQCFGSIRAVLCTWCRDGHVFHNDAKRSYVYCLTEQARARTARPVYNPRTTFAIPPTQAVQ